MSYFEWVQGVQQLFWDLDHINSRLHTILKESFENVYQTRNKYNIDMKTAAMSASIERLAKAMRLRGMWP